MPNGLAEAWPKTVRLVSDATFTAYAQHRTTPTLGALQREHGVGGQILAAFLVVNERGVSGCSCMRRGGWDVQMGVEEDADWSTSRMGS